MYYIGQDLILRMDVEGVSLDGDTRVSLDKIQVGSTPGLPYSPHSDIFWVRAWVKSYSSGILECELSEHHPDRVNSFFSQAADSGITKLILVGGQILRRLTGGHQPIPQHRPRQTPRDSYRSDRQSTNKPVVPVPVRKTPTEYPLREYQKDYAFRFQEMQIVDRGALFKAEFRIPNFSEVPIELLVKNDFLERGFDSIKPYLENRLGKHRVKVAATIQTQGATVLSTQATASVVDEINPDLIGRVKHWYIRRELSGVAEDKGLVTVEDIFNGIKESGLTPTDADFVEDILSIKKPTHDEHIRYLSARHLHTQVRLRLQKKPFAFLFMLLGRQNSFLVLETLNSKEATYLWKLNATAAELGDDRNLLRQKFDWVEQEISIISSEGRAAYRANAPGDFFAIWHDYESKDGFAVWKDRLDEVLDGKIDQAWAQKST